MVALNTIYIYIYIYIKVGRRGFLLQLVFGLDEQIGLWKFKPHGAQHQHFSIRRDQSNSTSSSRPESNNELTNSLEGRWCMVTVLMNLVILFIIPDAIYKEIM